MAFRKIRKVSEGSLKYEGAGVKLRRMFGNADVEDFDPFLLLDVFDSYDPQEYIKGFPWHPHRGIETVTYLIEGTIEHGDSLGNKGVITDGCCQWMTAGRGIIHQEMPQRADHLLGAQLWINLPSKEKMTKPVYRDISADKVRFVREPDAEVRVISGWYRGINGPVQGDYGETLYLDVQLNPYSSWEVETEAQSNLFCYVVCGSGSFNEESSLVPSGRVALMSEGQIFSVTSGSEGMRFLLVAGNALQEPIAWGGPIVMNSREELSKAFKELEEGTFIL